MAQSIYVVVIYMVVIVMPHLNLHTPKCTSSWVSQGHNIYYSIVNANYWFILEDHSLRMMLNCTGLYSIAFSIYWERSKFERHNYLLRYNPFTVSWICVCTFNTNNTLINFSNANKILIFVIRNTRQFINTNLLHWCSRHPSNELLLACSTNTIHLAWS